MKSKFSTILAGVIWILSSATTWAHDFWLEPDSFTPEINDSVAVSLRYGVGLKGDTLPYINALFNDFSITNQSGRTKIESIQGNDPAATVSATAGAQLLGYQSVPQFVELDAEKFDKYVQEEGIEYIRAERKRRGQSESPALENFVRCAKALIQTGAADDDIYRKKLGYTLELVPLSNPYQLEMGDTLEFELLYKGNPIEGLQLQALAKIDRENVQKMRTDVNGRASVTINQPGVWLVKVVIILPIAGSTEIIEGVKVAQLQSYWASYVFEMGDS
ncbi:MAG: DUF4198 domain-containing protein [Granulosicoccus sp.]